MNPYKILGVRRSATTAEIKAAYHRLAKKHHPDAGGDEETFKEITAAWRILQDDETRRIFDETGEADTTRIDQMQREAFSLLAQVFQSLLENGQAYDKRRPLMELIKNGVTSCLEQTHQAIRQANTKIGHLQDLRKRISRNDGKPNVFADMIDTHIRNAKGKLQSAEASVKAIEFLLEELKNYKSADEAIQQIQFQMYVSGLGGFGGGSTSSTGF